MPKIEVAPPSSGKDSTVVGLIKNLFDINSQIGRLIGHREVLGLHKSNEEDELHLEKNRLLFRLLEERRKTIDRGNQKSPAAKIEITVVKYPDEEFHPFSDPKIIFEIPHPENELKLHIVRAVVHSFCRDGLVRNSLELLKLIGEPIAYRKELLGDYVYRTFMEVRTIDKSISVIRKKGDYDNNSKEKERLSELDNLKFLLGFKLLTIRSQGLKLEKPIMVQRLIDKRGPSHDLIVISLGKDQPSFRILSPERYPPEICIRLRELITRGGGYDFEEPRKD